MSTQENEGPADGQWAPVNGIYRYLGWTFLGLVGLLIGSALLLGFLVYDTLLVALISIVVTTVAGAVIALVIGWWPSRRAFDRLVLRLTLAAGGALIALWAVHVGPLFDRMAQDAALDTITQAPSPAEARKRIEAMVPDNAYAAFYLYLADRDAQTKAQVNALFRPVQDLGVDWQFSADPKDHDALLALRTRLLDLDTILSAVPGKVPELYQAEWRDITTRAAQQGLSVSFRQQLEATTAQRQREYAVFYVAFGQLLRRAAEQLRDVIDAVTTAKVTRGADGKLVYGDDASRNKVEPLLSELDKTRAQIARLAEAAKALDQRYGLVPGR